uniref:SGNH hydrolase-type esterase domain-containing protein n=1 Tax=Cacopsylla melanoneura TaxID=428564 RepID=A0A8D9E2S4_9HEMI
MKPFDKPNHSKPESKPSKPDLNQSVSNNVPDKSKKYNMRSNPRQSLLNRSLSSVPKPSTSKSNKPTTYLSQPAPRRQSIICASTKPSGINHCQNSTHKKSKSKSDPNSKCESSKASSKAKVIGTPVTQNTSAAHPIVSVSSRPSADNQTLDTGDPSSSTSSVPSDTVSVTDLTVPPVLTHADHQVPASSQDITKSYSVNQLLTERNALIDRIQVLTTQLELQNGVQTPAPSTTILSSSSDISSPSKIAIFSDSMCRGIAQLMLFQLPNSHVTSVIKPGARFSQVVEPVASQCTDFGPTDYVFIQAGTNDMHSLQPNTAKRLSIPASLCNLSKQTNIVLCSVPYRYDRLAHLSTNIYETNNFLKFVSAKFDFHYLDTNRFMSRALYTEEGLHYNRRGKNVLANNFVDLIHSRSSGIRKFLSLTQSTRGTSLSIQHDNVQTIVSRNVSNVQTIAPRTYDASTQVRAYEIDINSTFGSFVGVDEMNHSNMIDIVDLSNVNDDLLAGPTNSNSYPIPVVSSNVYSSPLSINIHRSDQRSNFNFGDRTLVT